MQRLLSLTIAIMLLASACHSAHAGALPAPKGKTVLVVSGSIGNTNSGDSAKFDVKMLEALGMQTMKTTTPWYEGVVTFEGVPLEQLMKTVGATGSSVTAIALNDYVTKIPLEDFAKYHVLLAIKRDGQYMPVRDKGPLFIVYPFDSNPELQSQTYYGRSVI